MQLQFYYIAALAVLALLGGLLAARLLRQSRAAERAVRESTEHSQQAESDISTLRVAKLEIERRLAVEEQKTVRIPELEKALTAAAGRIDQSRQAKAAVDSELAVAREAIARLEAAANEARERQASVERSRDDLAAQIDLLREHTNEMERAVAGRGEAVVQNEQAALDLRQRLAAAEAARDQAIARIDSAVQAKAGAEATLARAASQIQEKAQRVEALEEELRQARSDVETRFDSLTQAKASLEANAAAAAGQLQEKTQRVGLLEDELRQQRNQSQSRLDALGAARTALEANLAAASAQLKEKGTRVEALLEELRQAKAEGAAARNEMGQQNARLAALQEGLEQERKHGAEKLALLSNAREQMTQEFRSLAEDVLRRHGDETNRQSKADIDVVLTPLRERLSEFQQGLASAHDENVRQRAALADQIRSLSDSSLQMASEAQQLASALRGRAEGLGAWGEMLLSSILERSGLREGEDYVFRENYSADGGERLRPDVAISLPGDQRVLVDSRVPLAAYQAYVNAEAAEGAALLADHASSMAAHIRALAEGGTAPVAESRRDYRVMFVPVEGALAAALRHDPELLGLAVENNIAIATPGTLMMALRSVANVWQAERRNRRAEAIAERAGKLHDSFAAYLGDVEVLGDHLVRARHAYEEAMGRLTGGRESLIGQVEELRDMGAKAGKPMRRIAAAEQRDGDGDVEETGPGMEEAAVMPDADTPDGNAPGA